MNAAQDFSFGEFEEASSTLIMTNRPQSAIVPVAKPVTATMLPPPLPTVEDSIDPVSFDPDPTSALRSKTKKYRRATIVLSFALLTALSLAGTLAYAMFSGATVPAPRVARQGITRMDPLSLEQPVSSPDASLKAASNPTPTKRAKKRRPAVSGEPEVDLSGRDLLSDGLSE